VCCRKLAIGAWKESSPNDLICVQTDDKLYSLAMGDGDGAKWSFDA